MSFDVVSLIVKNKREKEGKRGEEREGDTGIVQIQDQSKRARSKKSAHFDIFLGAKSKPIIEVRKSNEKASEKGKGKRKEKQKEGEKRK